jgi:hypothetical protein
MLSNKVKTRKNVLIINFLSHGNQVKSWFGNWQWYIYTHCQIARLISDFRQCRELPKKITQNEQ